MTTQQNQLLQLFKAAESARQTIDEATDIPDFEDGQLVTPLEEAGKSSASTQGCATFWLSWRRPLTRRERT